MSFTNVISALRSMKEGVVVEITIEENRVKFVDKHQQQYDVFITDYGVPSGTTKEFHISGIEVSRYVPLDSSVDELKLIIGNLIIDNNENLYFTWSCLDNLGESESETIMYLGKPLSLAVYERCDEDTRFHMMLMEDEYQQKLNEWEPYEPNESDDDVDDLDNYLDEPCEFDTYDCPATKSASHRRRVGRIAPMSLSYDAKRRNKSLYRLRDRNARQICA